MVKQCLLAIDAGASAVKVLAAEVDKEGSISIAASGTVPSAGITKGNIVDTAALVKAIREAVDCVRMATDVSVKQTFLGLSCNATRSYNSIGSIAPASLNGINAQDIERVSRAATLVTVPDDYCVLHVLPTAFWVDGQKEIGDPIGKCGSRLEAEVHIVAMPLAIVNELKELMAAAGIPVTGIVANSIVGSSAMPALAEPCIFIDMGAGVTDIVVRHSGHIRMSATLPLGGDYITSDVMHGLNVSRAHAEEIKRYYSRLDKQSLRERDIILDCNDYGTTDKKISLNFLHDVIESRVDEIVSLVHHYLSPAVAGFSPQKIYITGGCALMPSITNAFERMFGIPVRIVAPDVAREYSHPANYACFGILKHTSGLSAAAGDAAANPGKSLFAKIKSILWSETVR